jgi:hypothetical protein
VADAPDNPSRPTFGSAPGKRGASSGDILTGPSSSRAVVSSNDPRLSSRASFDVLDPQVDRLARLQMIVALFLVLVLVAIPLYLWRRPRAESIPVSMASNAAIAAPPPSAAPAAEEKVILGEAKTLSCHDPGPKKTLPEQCDHVAPFEKALAAAIEESAACVPRDAGGGTILFVADVNFKKKHATVSTPKEGRTLKNPKVVPLCERAVKSRLLSVPLDGFKHEHARYRISMTATYPGAVKP